MTDAVREVIAQHVTCAQCATGTLCDLGVMVKAYRMVVLMRQHRAEASAREVERLRIVLAWYADAHHYDRIRPSPGVWAHGLSENPDWAWVPDAGARARNALNTALSAGSGPGVGERSPSGAATPSADPAEPGLRAREGAGE